MLYIVYYIDALIMKVCISLFNGINFNTVWILKTNTVSVQTEFRLSKKSLSLLSGTQKIGNPNGA